MWIASRGLMCSTTTRVQTRGISADAVFGWSYNFLPTDDEPQWAGTSGDTMVRLWYGLPRAVIYAGEKWYAPHRGNGYELLGELLIHMGHYH